MNEEVEEIQTGTSVIKAQEAAILVFPGKKTDDKKSAVRDLYDALRRTRPYADHLRDSGLTWEEMYAIAERMREAGLTWEKAYYMPIQFFCRVKTLRYLLVHKQDAMGNNGSEAFGNVYNYLKRCFIWILG